MKKMLSVLFNIFAGLFIASIIVGLVGRLICVRSTQNYRDLQPELFAPDNIATVLYDEDQALLYVCYNDASYVNVYTESGEFLWAVSTPYLRNVYFELQEKRLIIHNYIDAYIYNSTDGRFVECVDAEDLQLEDELETEKTDKFQEDEFYFDTYQVYKAHSDGSLETLIARPWWYWCFNFFVCWCVAFINAIGVGVIIFINKIKPSTLTNQT